MTFERPLAFALLLLVPLIVGLYLLMLRRRRRMAVSFASLSLIRGALPGRTRWRRRLPFALLLLAIASLAVAAARPQATVTVPVNRTTILLALDVSLSMCSTDIAPNRLTVAQEVARSFVSEQPAGTKIGLIAFAGGAQLLVPPTADRKALGVAIDSLHAGRGTAVGTALLRSVDAIAGINPNVPRADLDPAAAAPRLGLPPGAFQPDIVVLLSDGATTQGVAPMRAAQQAADRRIRVYPIGFGTTNPAPLVCTREQLGTDVFANAFAGGGGRGFDGPPRSVLRVDERTLQAIADLTGGTYHRAADAAELVDVFRNLPREILLQQEHTEVSFAFTALGALLALGATGLSLAWNRYP